mmetsp:Transcript_11280/g.33783  ORF Transcript_11280/g.33783 Transcript_11280/m.33783 type:complete len:206 (+) Transcript_11280:143-760(+)
MEGSRAKRMSHGRLFPGRKSPKLLFTLFTMRTSPAASKSNSVLRTDLARPCITSTSESIELTLVSAQVASPISITEGSKQERDLFLSHIKVRRLALDQKAASGNLFSGVKSALEGVGLGWYVHEENAPQPQQPPTATTTTAPMPNTDNDPNDDTKSGEESGETAKKKDSLTTRSQAKGAAQSDMKTNLCQQTEIEAAAFLLITST